MKRSQNQSLAREKSYIAIGTGSLLTAVATGFATYFITGMAVWKQWTYLMHPFAGVVLTLVLLPYALHHVYRTIGARRPAVLFAGLLALFALLYLSVTGLFFIFKGQTEANRWIYDTHIYAGFFMCTLLLAHLLLHHFTRRKRKGSTQNIYFLSLERASIMRGIQGTLILFMSIWLASVLYALKGSSYTAESAVTPYELPYGAHPFRPSQTETASGDFVDARQVANSNTCSSCHQQIFDEWKGSMHSQAASDRAYTTNINLLSKKRGIVATRYCEGCHAPAALLSGELTPLGKHGGIANTLANREGVSCMACHGIVEAVHLKGVASYKFKPADEYLFGDSLNPIARKLTNFLIKVHPQEHREIMSPDILSSSTLCATCHAQFMDKDMNDWGWVKMQDEYSAWLGSHYSGSTQQTFSKQETTRCQDCHMPQVHSSDPSADRNGLAASHRSLGANTAIPHYTADTEQLLLVREFMQEDKIRIAIEKPWRADARRSNQHLPEQLRAESEMPHYYYLNETAKLRVTVTNHGVGHDFPGGTIDINEAWIDFNVTDSEGSLVYRSGALDDQNNVDENAVFYRAIAIDRNGKHVWKHDLFNMVGDSYKNTIKAGESDIVEYVFNIPSWVKGQISVTAVLRYRKFNNRYARWALDDESIELPIVDMAQSSITIPILERPAAYDKR